MARSISVVYTYDEDILAAIYRETEASVGPMKTIMRVPWADSCERWAETMSRQVLLLAMLDAEPVGWIAFVQGVDELEAHVCRWEPIHMRTCLHFWRMSLQWLEAYAMPQELAVYIPIERYDVARLAAHVGFTPIGGSENGWRRTKRTR